MLGIDMYAPNRFHCFHSLSCCRPIQRRTTYPSRLKKRAMSVVRWQWPVLVPQSRECPRPSNVGHQSHRFRIAGGNVVKQCIYSIYPGKPFPHLNLNLSLIRSADNPPRLSSLSQEPKKKPKLHSICRPRIPILQNYVLVERPS